jgi:signal transduction histidine kinase
MILETDPVQAALVRTLLESLGCEVVASELQCAGHAPGAPPSAGAATEVSACSCGCEAVPSLAVGEARSGAVFDERPVSPRADAESWVAASIAHDLNNAITALRAQLYVAHARSAVALPMAECQEILDHCTTLAKRLLASAKPHDRASRATPARVDLRDCVSDALRLAASALPSDISVVSQLGAVPAFVCFHPELIVDAVVNLVFNARDALPRGGAIHVSISSLIGAYHQLTVSDSGIGMAPETLTSAFEPYFTTKGREHGTGLGLPGVRRTIEEAGGTVAIRSEVGKGTEVSILLPRAAAMQSSPTSER